MAWLAVCDQNAAWLTPLGGAEELVVRGALVIETRLPELRRLKPLLAASAAGDWPMSFALQALPGGGLSLILDLCGEVVNHVIDCADSGRADVLRITYAWDAPARSGWLAIERPGRDQITLLPCPNPRPMHRDHIAALIGPGPDRYLSPEVLFAAASDAVEPVGPQPALTPGIPIATPDGARRAGDLRRGDLVLTAEGSAVPVLHAISRIVPGRGTFAPVCLRAPYFGLRQDIAVASTQKLLIDGSEVEYLFGRETVRLQAGHLLGSPQVQPVRAGWLVPYFQLVLPDQETMIAAGCPVESLNIGRIRRKPALLGASILADLDRASLPEHATPASPVLHAFDAIVLAEHRAA